MLKPAPPRQGRRRHAAAIKHDIPDRHQAGSGVRYILVVDFSYEMRITSGAKGLHMSRIWACANRLAIRSSTGRRAPVLHGGSSKEQALRHGQEIDLFRMGK
jgi:hypothetical protein